ncbi:hypothetical protein [Sulfitobacter sp. S190]|uniref:hypothetical protein n=1 Tax=Sulfitobacter sp. S190 TaxID=2867022 RepID=UPI0021A8DC78|nr:hypothetical protein [Sulfitobacter sp. S190]UWR23583.1 hypothetical protein K3756_06310 [Sulfitobacter sp. S190]
MLQLDMARHALSCDTCGAPLQQMKAVPVARAAPKPAVSHQPAPKLRTLPKAAKPKKVKKQKRRKSWLSRAAEEAFDLIEDIFD